MVKRNKNDFSHRRRDLEKIYVFLKLLADAKIQAADKDGIPSPNFLCKVLRVKHGEVEAVMGGDITFKNVQKSVTLPRIIIKDNAEYLYHIIRNSGTQDYALRIPKIEQFLKDIGYTMLTGVSKRNMDIQINGMNFNIKSEVGCVPVLLNASKSTNLIFELKGLSSNDIRAINSITGSRKIIQRCEYIKKQASKIEFIGFVNDTFRRNLQGIDNGLPKIIAECIYAHYFENCVTSEDAVTYLKKSNPHCFLSDDLNFYETKYKRFLHSVALGMKPAIIWDDKDEATGGYIIAKPNGELVAFFIYDRSLFDDYLYAFTFFERASTTRHDFMQAYEMDKKVFINLNLQIRFKS